MARAPQNSKKIPDRETAPTTGFSLDKLAAELDALGQAGGSNLRAHVLTHLKSHLATSKDFARERFEHGRLDGLETARVIAALHDDIVKALWNFTTQHIAVPQTPSDAERISLCAVGGYGRGEMAPESDLDLLFLTADKTASTYTTELTEYILYMLWDLGLKVGHASRTVDQCLKLAKEDQTILTSLLDVRHLAGEEDLSETLYRQFRKNITRGKGRAYISAKLEERDLRHAQEGNSRYVIEPNIKEGKGGLRDLHVLYWITRFIDRDGKITDPQRAMDYTKMGLFDARAAVRFRRAADFLWRTRHHLHWAAGRPTEQLSFDMQVRLAPKMGHAVEEVEVAVERFMREYFTNAREVGALTRIACAKLEAEKAIRLPKSLDAFLPGSRRNLKNKDFFIDHGRLNFADPMTIREKPSQILQLFETAGRRNIDIHPDAFSAIDFRRNLIDREFRGKLEHSEIFQKTLLSAKAPYATLKTMNEAGVLGRYLSEFGGIVARTQFNMHHAYTVDEHTLRLIDNYDNLAKGRLEDDIPIATKVAAGFTKTQRLTMMLACLLHDTGKGKGDQCIEGAQLAHQACRRLGIPQDITDDVAWLVRRHLDMSETAQRRDISDPETIENFAKLMGSKRRLDLLLVLTVSDIRAVGPGIWNDWKATLLRSLYLATETYLEGRADLEPSSKIASRKEQLLENLTQDEIDFIAPITRDLPDGYLLGFSMAKMVMHARFFETLLKSGHDPLTDTATKTHINLRRNVTELWVLTRNRSGLFRDLSLAVTASGASITGARLNTGEDGLVLDVFYLLGPDGEAFGAKSPHLLEALRATASHAARGQTSNLVVPKALKSRRAGAIPVRPKVRFPATEAEDTCIIEVQGRDRVGLLHELSAYLTEAGFDISTAHIEVVGAMAVDVFYIRCAVLDDKTKKRLRAGLLDILRDPEPKSKAA
jgi:[protein-PII] uridylyltransferase